MMEIRLNIFKSPQLNEIRQKYMGKEMYYEEPPDRKMVDYTDIYTFSYLENSIIHKYFKYST